VDYYVELSDAIGDGKTASNWVQQDVLRTLNEQNITIDRFPVRARQLADLIETVKSGKLTTSRGREVLTEMIATGKPLDEAMQGMGIQAVDESDLEGLCRELLAANPKVVAEVREGKLKGVGQLIGQAKKKNPNVDPNRVREICLELVQRGE
jgi:aspartyl-tRNA(Asn)/glutamyl-tRNA(Gln) amidotransferase subunit B